MVTSNRGGTRQRAGFPGGNLGERGLREKRDGRSGLGEKRVAESATRRPLASFKQFPAGTESLPALPERRHSTPVCGASPPKCVLYSCRDSHGPQIANVIPGSCTLTNIVAPSAEKHAPANSLEP